MNVSLRQLKAFVMIAKLQNFSRAAERLYIAQSGLSTMIRELEGQLGFRLFDRSTRKVTLTDSGQQFLPVAEQSIRGIEDVVARVGSSAKQASTRLTIAAPPMACAYLLPSIVSEFASRHPDVSLKILDVDVAKITALVLTGEADIGLGMFVKPTPGLERRSLFKYSLMLASRATKFQLARSPRSWIELAGKPLIALPSEYPFQQTVDRHLEDAGHTAPPRMVVNYIETQIGMVSEGRGDAILPTTAIAACRSRPVRLEPLVAPLVELEYYEIRDRAKSLPSCASEFTELFMKYTSKFAAPRIRR